MAKKKTNINAPKQNPLKSTAMASLLGMVSVLAIVTVAWFFVAAPYLAEQQKAKEDITTLETEQNSLIAQVASLQDTKALTPNVQEYDYTLTQHFPTEAEANAMREGIYRIAAENNVFVNVGMSAPQVIDQAAPGEAAPPVTDTTDTDPAATPTPAEPAEPAEPTTTADAAAGSEETTDTDGTIAQIDVTLTISGNYDNVGKFLDRFYSEFQRGFIIDSFSVSGGSEKDSDGNTTSAYNVAISGKTFLYRPTLSPDEIKANENVAATDEVTDDASATPTPTPAGN